MRPDESRVGVSLADLIVVVLSAATLAGGSGAGRSGDDARLRLYGNVDIREVDLAYRVAGRLVETGVDEGAAVVEGDTLARLDDAPYRLSLAAAEARAAQAGAVVERLRAGSRAEEIDAARAAVGDARAAASIAAQNLDRKRTMAEDDATSEREVDEAVAASDRADAQLASARAALALAEAGPRSEDIAAAEAELAAAIAERDRLALQLEDTVLTAPAPGVILSRVREAGAMLAAGEPVLVLSLTRRVDVRAWVSGPDLGQVAPGAPVSITTDVNDRVYTGRVGFVSPRAEFTPKTVETPELRTDLVYRLRISVDDPDDALRQGMPVTVDIGES